MPVKERGGHDLFQRLLVGTAYPDGKLELVFRITGERRDFEGYIDICSIDAHDPVSGDCGRLHFRSEDALLATHDRRKHGDLVRAEVAADCLDDVVVGLGACRDAAVRAVLGA